MLGYLSRFVHRGRPFVSQPARTGESQDQDACRHAELRQAIVEPFFANLRLQERFDHCTLLLTARVD
jgi:hypothetical protein